MKIVTARRGAALIVALVTLLVVMLITATLIRSLLVAHKQARLRQNGLQAEWLAEAAVARAVAQLDSRPEYNGETWSADLGEIGTATGPQGGGIAEIRVQEIEKPRGRVRIIVEAHYPNDPQQRATSHREYTVIASRAARGAGGAASENTP